MVTCVSGGIRMAVLRGARVRDSSVSCSIRRRTFKILRLGTEQDRKSCPGGLIKYTRRSQCVTEPTIPQRLSVQAH